MALDIVNILEMLGSCNAIRLNKIMDQWYSMCCPFHNNGNEKRPSSGMTIQDSFSGGIMRKRGTFHCFACGEIMGIKEFVERIFQMKDIPPDIRKAISEQLELADESELEFLIPESTMKALESKFIANRLVDAINKTKNLAPISEEELRSYRYTVPYMYQRGLTDELIEKYDIGVDLNYVPKGRTKPIPSITFPVRDYRGVTIFIARRSIEGKHFFIPDDVEKPVYGMWELPEGCKSVVITESCFNCLTSVKYGRPAVALLGTGTPRQVQQLKQLGVTEFILGLDPDEAGKRGTARLKKALKDIAFVWEFEGIPEGKDINDLTEEEFKSLNIV